MMKGGKFDVKEKDFLLSYLNEDSINILENNDIEYNFAYNILSKYTPGENVNFYLPLILKNKLIEMGLTQKFFNKIDEDDISLLNVLDILKNEDNETYFQDIKEENDSDFDDEVITKIIYPDILGDEVSEWMFETVSLTELKLKNIKSLLEQLSSERDNNIKQFLLSKFLIEKDTIVTKEKIDKYKKELEELKNGNKEEIIKLIGDNKDVNKVIKRIHILIDLNYYLLDDYDRSNMIRAVLKEKNILFQSRINYLRQKFPGNFNLILELLDDKLYDCDDVNFNITISRINSLIKGKNFSNEELKEIIENLEDDIFNLNNIDFEKFTEKILDSKSDFKFNIIDIDNKKEIFDLTERYEFIDDVASNDEKTTNYILNNLNNINNSNEDLFKTEVLRLKKEYMDISSNSSTSFTSLATLDSNQKLSVDWENSEQSQYITGISPKEQKDIKTTAENSLTGTEKIISNTVTEKLLKIGFIVKETLPIGNCFFEAIAWTLLNGIPSIIFSVNQLRENLYNQLLTNRSTIYKDLGLDTDTLNELINLDNNIKKNESYVETDIQIQQMAIILKRPIHIYYNDDNIGPYIFGIDIEGEPLNLLRSDISIQGTRYQHYDALLIKR